MICSDSIINLYDSSYLIGLDEQFQVYLRGCGDELYTYMMHWRGRVPPEGMEHSCWLIEAAMALDGFLLELFGAEGGKRRADELAAIYACNDRFIRKRAIHFYKQDSVDNIDGVLLRGQIEDKLGSAWSDISYARAAMAFLSNEGDAEADHWAQIFMQYAAWAIYSEDGRKLHKGDVIFNVPSRLQHDARFHCERDKNRLYSGQVDARNGFQLTDRGGFCADSAGYNANYCIFCHKRNKDSCSKGLFDAQHQIKKSHGGEMLAGCPLGQKISEMNYLKSIGMDIGALAVVVVDNPMCAGTGHRICNDCSKACIYQNYEPVDIPLIETNVLNAVLEMQWGFEIYSLLTRWNPLNLRSPLPKAPSQGRALIVGMGPAGYTLAHYLLNEGHWVVGVDGIKIEPLPIRLVGYLDASGKRVGFEPISDIHNELFAPLEERVATGFGGVAEYGITVRWNKNYLTVIRLLLERRDRFALYDGITLGSNLLISEALEQFHHVSIACGAGRPKTLDIPNGLATGVRYASDFLMSLQLGGAYRGDSISNLQIRMPVIVIGGGLTAVDAATEALAYYPVQVKKFKNRLDILRQLGREPVWTEREGAIVDEFEAGYSGRVTLAYRGAMVDSPAYRLNPHELKSALGEGVEFLERAELLDIEVDLFGDVSAAVFSCGDEVIRCAARTIILAIGTEANLAFATKDAELLHFSGDGSLAPIARTELGSEVFCNDSFTVSALGDLNPKYSGSVVKAMASAKDAYRDISDAITAAPPLGGALFDSLSKSWIATLISKEVLSDGIIELKIFSPIAARHFSPGQFYKIQNYEISAESKDYPLRTVFAMEGVALTGWRVERDVVSLIVLDLGASSSLCKHLRVNERVFLMGPVGSPSHLPNNEVVMLVGGGIGNITNLSLGKALRERGCRVIGFAGYREECDRVKTAEMEEACDVVVWACDNYVLSTNRDCDFSFRGNIIDAICAYSGDRGAELGLQSVNRVFAVGSCDMMRALSEFVNESNLFADDCEVTISVNAPMQCMLKGLCGQCIQKVGDGIVFTCCTQDHNAASVDFSILKGRLRQNSVQERLCLAWTEAAFE